MRYNINKKKHIKLTIKNLVIFFYLFLIVSMINLYKYRHYVLVIILIIWLIWLIWYVKYDSKIKEGWWWKKKKKKKSREQLEREKRARRRKEEERRRREEERRRREKEAQKEMEVSAHNNAMRWACRRKGWQKHKNWNDKLKEFYGCYLSHDVKRVGTQIKER